MTCCRYTVCAIFVRDEVLTTGEPATDLRKLAGNSEDKVYNYTLP